MIHKATERACAHGLEERHGDSDKCVRCGEGSKPTQETEITFQSCV